jgi:hypothetical protein
MTRADLRQPIASRWDVRPVARSEAMLPGSYASVCFLRTDMLVTHLVDHTEKDQEKGEDDDLSDTTEVCCP